MERRSTSPRVAGIALTCLTTLAACDTATQPSPSGAPSSGAPQAPAVEASGERTDGEAAALARAQTAATTLGGALRARLLAALAEGGPAHAVEVCAAEARVITARVSEETGARVDRASLRERGTHETPAWVVAWLSEQGERPAEGVTGLARIEDGRARVLRPIVVETPCLTCHGEAIAPEIAAILDARYPDERARGYRVGDLRGALWAEVTVATP